MTYKVPFYIHWQIRLFTLDFINIIFAKIPDSCIIGLPYLFDGFGLTNCNQSDICRLFALISSNFNFLKDRHKIFLDHCLLFLHLKNIIRFPYIHKQGSQIILWHLYPVDVSFKSIAFLQICISYILNNMDQRDQELEEIEFQSYNQGSSKENNDNVKVFIGLLIIVCLGALFFHSSEDSNKNIQKTPGLVQNEDNKTKLITTEKQQEQKTMNKVIEQSAQQSSIGESEEKDSEETDQKTDQSNEQEQKGYQGQEKQEKYQNQESEKSEQKEPQTSGQQQKAPFKKQQQYQAQQERHSSPITIDENQQQDPNQQSIEQIQIKQLQKQILRLEKEIQAQHDEIKQRQLNRESQLKNYINTKLQQMKKEQAIQQEMQQQKIREIIRQEIEIDKQSYDPSTPNINTLSAADLTNQDPYQQSPDQSVNIQQNESSEKVHQEENQQSTLDAPKTFQSINNNDDSNADNNVDHSVDQSADQSVDQSPDQSVDQSADQSPDQSADQSPDQSADQSPDQSVDHSVDSSVENNVNNVDNADTSTEQKLNEVANENQRQALQTKKQTHQIKKQSPLNTLLELEKDMIPTIHPEEKKNLPETPQQNQNIQQRNPQDQSNKPVQTDYNENPSTNNN